jgi:N,N'-diacetyllegionaminate synthase
MSNISKIIIIAEAGVNHNGSLSKALKLVKKAKWAGADIIKFQVADSSMITKDAKKADYQILNTKIKHETQYEMVRKLELNWDVAHKKIIQCCKKNKIEFLTSAFSLKGLEIIKKLKLKRLKIPSGEINNVPYLEKIAKFKKKIILSTGMANLQEIENCIKILNKNGVKKKHITVLHCNTAYPTPIEDCNLRAIQTIKKKFNIKVGYSDHTTGLEASIAAISLGAEIIEKHLTLDKTITGPDHKASLNPIEFKNMVMNIRNITKAFGSGIKKPSKSEKKNIKVVRKSIVAIKNIKKGDVLNIQNIDIKRPGYGMSPLLWYKTLGKKSKKNYNIDDLINES